MRNYPRINIGVGGLILRGGSEVLLVKRKSDSLTWTIPSGYVKKKENLFETISREVKEETNIIIKPKGIIGIRQRFTKREGNNFWIIVIADYKSGKAEALHFLVGQVMRLSNKRADFKTALAVLKQELG